jgi:hypothetical protein
MSTCRQAQLWELSMKLHALLRPLAEERHLWAVLRMQYANGAVACDSILTLELSSDLTTRRCYRVQFQDEGCFIYLVRGTMNLWEMVRKVEERGAVLANGRPIVVVNEGKELDPANFEPNKYYIHVKDVQPYFTEEERKLRTALERNHNVNKFYFDVAFRKSREYSIVDCWLERTIFVLPHAIPYLNSRVKIPSENIQKLEYRPIEVGCQFLQQTADRLKDAMNRNDRAALQQLLQGALLVQVSEGTIGIAEAFLAGATENEHTQKLKQILRVVIKTQAEALKIYEREFVATREHHRPLQAVLDDGQRRLVPSLQWLLKETGSARSSSLTECVMGITRRTFTSERAREFVSHG